MSDGYNALLRLSAAVRHREDTVDAVGDVATTETVVEGVPCHAYQRYLWEETDGRMLGVETLIVHLLADVAVTTGDRIDITWPDGTGVRHAEVIGPPARRVRARTGKVHHIECRTREIA